LVRAWTKREAWLDGRLTLSPHAAFYSPASLVDMRSFSLETVLAHLETGSSANCVNAQYLKKPKIQETAAKAGTRRGETP
jgi:D-3-phosphoglycerate dehydrogenase/C-terminal binding protein